MSRSPECPPRPNLPLALWALIVVLVTERVVLGESLTLAKLFTPAVILVLVVAIVAAVFALTHHTAALPLILVLTCSLVVAGLVAALEVASQQELEEVLSSSSISTWEFTLVGDMTPTSAGGWQGRAEASLDGTVMGEVWLSSDEELSYGSTISCIGRFSANEGDDWGVSSRMQGIAGSVSVVLVQEQTSATGLFGLVVSLREAVLESLDPYSSEARALIAGLACGYRGAIKTFGLDDIFSEAGVSHLVAVSGAHLSLVSALVGAVLSRTRMPPGARGLVLLLVTGVFVLFCGAPVSAVRAWLMSVVAELSGIVGRRTHTPSSVSAVALVMALLEPGVSGQLGYLLSVVSVLGMSIFGSYANYALRVVAGRGPRWPRAWPQRLRKALEQARRDAMDSLSTSLVCQLVTMPLTTATFSELSLVGPLSGVLTSPLFEPLVVLSVLSAALAWAPILQTPLLACTDAIAELMLWVLQAVASLPGASVAVSVDESMALAFFVALAVALLVAWPHLTRARVAGVAGAILVSVAVYLGYWGLFAPARIVVLDVGQGDAILITDGSSSVLVDTGPGSDVVEALAAANVVDLDAVIITHLHDDHVGGLEDVISSYGCELVFVADGVELDVDEGVEVKEVSYGDVLMVGDFELTVVSPTEEVDGSENEHSLVLSVSYDDGERTMTALLTGDAEAEVLWEVVDRGDIGDIDVLKVAHHGSEASIDDELARVLLPEVSIASAGEGNSYGHPTEACIEILESAGSLFLCTIDCGSITVEPDEEGVLVSY